MKGVIIQKQHPVVVEESFSNLTTDVSLSNSSHQDGCNMLLQHQYFAPPTQNQPAVKKKKRNLPGNPDPDSEVIALSPKALLATNRFVCEVCKKGFQRDQNLQLHRRGHNLPWKLKQRTVGKDAVRKKVYVCPEPGCVHHDPARALGDLTGIKKHFCRKHGEKKWKCDKCSKRYAVQSDWKAHSKTCGTREYRCDCGTLFSRRDSFITHRAFCDALAEENGRAITGNIPVLPSQSNSNGHPFPLLKNEQQDYYFSPRQPQILPPWLPSPQQQQQVSALGLGGHGPPIFSSSSSRSDHHHHHQVFKPHESSNPNPTHGPTIPPPPHMSATALLQKAAQMGVTMRSSTPPAAMTMLDGTHQAHVSADSGKVTTGFALNLNPPPAHIASGFGGSLSFFGNKAADTENDAGTGAGAGAHPCLVQEMIMANSLDQSATGFDGRCSFEEEENAFGGALEEAEGTRHHQYSSSSFSSRVDNAMEIGVFGGHGNDSMTRDFLGLRAAISNGDIFSIPGFNTSMNTTSKELQNSWQG